MKLKKNNTVITAATKKLLVMAAMLSTNALMLHAQQLTLRLDKAETEVSPMLYGLMTE